MYGAFSAWTRTPCPAGQQAESGDWPKSGVNYGKDVIPVVVGKEFLYQFEDTRRSQNSSKRQRWSGETDANGNQLPPLWMLPRIPLP